MIKGIRENIMTTKAWTLLMQKRITWPLQWRLS